jgi:hypothetical protein
MRRRCLIALGSGLLLGCATAPPESPTEWLQRMLAREVERSRQYEIASSDGFLSARSSARLRGEIEEREGSYYAQLDLGSEVPIECIFYSEQLHLASSLGIASQSNFDVIASRVGPLQQKQIGAIDAGSVDDNPYLGVEWIYVVQHGDDAIANQFEAFIGRKRARSIMCQHNELGFSRSLREVFVEILESVEFSEPDAPGPYYREVWTATIRDRKVGVMETMMSLDADGDTRVDAVTALVIPVDESTLATTDSYEVEFSRPDGTMINKIGIEVENQELITELQFGPVDANSWAVSGMFQGKQIESRIPRNETLLSYVGQTWALRDAITEVGVGATVALKTWTASDPTRLVDSVATIHAERSDGDFDASFRLGAMRVDGVVDRSGLMLRGHMQMGHVLVELERVFADGEF